MRRELVGLLVLPCVLGGAATLRMPTAAARADEAAERSGGVHAAARMARWMTGHFEADARQTDHGSLPGVSMRACQITLPALGNHVVYVEQSFRGADGSVGRPFDQRVYALDAASPHAHVVAREFTLVDPVAARGLCDHPSALPAVNTLEEGVGCALHVRTVGHALRGSTDGEQCPSTVNGARYTRRTLEITAQGVTVDDMGYDADGRTTWGGQGAWHFTRTDAEES